MPAVDYHAVTLDRTLLVSGHTYAIVINTMTGGPGAATGDLETIAYPYDRVTEWSHYFTVR
jgi:hypothetical protein